MQNYSSTKRLAGRSAQICMFWAGLVVSTALIAVGIYGLVVSYRGGETVGEQPDSSQARFPSQETKAYEPLFFMPRIPISRKPGPPRGCEKQEFILNESNSVLMSGLSAWGIQRWCDMAGNFYSTRLIREFSYERPGPSGPFVRVRVEPEGPTLKGRLEARGLKPNFAYQIKLRGLPEEDFEAFERIGYAGRWRLPGWGTNYTDEDYRQYPDKKQVEAYLFFDFFVTDKKGDAIRDFELDSSLHVLWNASRQTGTPNVSDLEPVMVVADDPLNYAIPRARESLELIWAEREMCRYRHADELIRLPPGEYIAEIVLTEESFHSPYNDGGYWATVLACPAHFTITEMPTNQQAKGAQEK